MGEFVKIYKIQFIDKPMQLVMPSMTDIKILISENEDILDMLLMNKIHITCDNVSIHSKVYETALKNRLVEPTK